MRREDVKYSYTKFKKIHNMHELMVLLSSWFKKKHYFSDYISMFDLKSGDVVSQMKVIKKNHFCQM